MTGQFELGISKFEIFLSLKVFSSQFKLPIQNFLRFNRRFTQMDTDKEFFKSITAETQSTQRQTPRILNRRLAQINADGDSIELVFCLSGDDDKQKGKLFCPIVVSRLGKILSSATSAPLR